MPLQPDSTPKEDFAYFFGLAICLLVVMVVGIPVVVAFFG